MSRTIVIHDALVIDSSEAPTMVLVDSPDLEEQVWVGIDAIANRSELPLVLRGDLVVRVGEEDEEA